MTGPVKGLSRPTMADVAKRAGVSPTAVSFVVNGKASGSISTGIQQRVREAIEELDYRPNIAAQGLRTRRTRTIGFVTDEITVKAAGGRTISGVHGVARRHGSALLIADATRDPRVLRRTIEDMLDRQIDAIVFAVVGTRRASLPDAVRHVPTVLVNCFAAEDALPCILPDETAGGRAATDLLIAAGHRRIAYLTGLPGAWATRKRLSGYRSALRKAGIATDELLVSHGNFRADSGYALTRDLLARDDRPTAILCGNDLMAVGAYFAVKEEGLCIPDDISIVGYDDQEDLALDLQPALTTVRLPYHEMGRLAAEQIFAGTVARLPTRTLMPCPAVVRDSVGPLRPA
jgi:LacI family transcriptional regulator